MTDFSAYTDPSTLGPIGALAPGTRIHFVGIGGAGMSPLAQLALERGLPVSGSDLRGGGSCEPLRALGAHIDVGHDAGQVDGADLVVVSNAVPPGNVERARAEQTGIPVILRADMLELLMEGYRRILISGTHGKTTTTAMTTVALRGGGMDPSFAIGGAMQHSSSAGSLSAGGSTAAHHGRDEVFVAEADEAFRSFLRLTPDVAIITNLEMDHHDEYGDLSAYRQAFVEFLGRRTAAGVALLCADDPGTRDLARDVTAPLLTYGTTAGADVLVHDMTTTGSGGSRFRLTDSDGEVGNVTLGVPGLHNMLNAAAAISAVKQVGGDVAGAIAGLADFTGALRRFQRLGTVAGVSVVDDYGHHPTELIATLSAARQANPDGRVIAVFQPHRYSRTQAMGVELGRALAAADLVIVTDIYAASESPIPGVTGALVADAAAQAVAERAVAERAVAERAEDATARPAEVRFHPVLTELPDLLVELSRPGDLIMTMGAGDITRLGPLVLDRLAAVS